MHRLEIVVVCSITYMYTVMQYIVTRFKLYKNKWKYIPNQGRMFSLASNWAILGQQLGYSWPATELLLASNWAILGQQMGYSWPATGLFLASNCAILGQQLG